MGRLPRLFDRASGSAGSLPAGGEASVPRLDTRQGCRATCTQGCVRYAPRAPCL